VIRGADHLIELGPAPARHGGRVVFEGTVDELLAHPTPLTARTCATAPPTLARRTSPASAARRRGWRAWRRSCARPRVRSAARRAHNLRDVDVELPLGALVAVTGVSGSGKSTLVENVLYEGWRARRGEVDADPGEVGRARSGLDDLAEVLLVDQRPLGRSTRSNPVTYVGAYDELRKPLRRHQIGEGARRSAPATSRSTSTRAAARTARAPASGGRPAVPRRR
jgi:excinuclease ABC subunit A